MVLAASIRSVKDWHDIALLGADVVTIPPALFDKAFEHPLTRDGMLKFQKDWSAVSKNLL